MRRLLSLSTLVLFALVVPAVAQITISTNTFQPSPGTIIKTKMDPTLDSTFYNYLTAGSGGPITWDFSARQYGADFLEYVVSTLTAPGIDSFPQANLCLMIPLTAADTSWSYYTSASNAFVELGLETHTTAVQVLLVYHDSAADDVFPMTYNSHWVAHHTYKQTLPQTYTNYADTTTYTVDAYGTAKYGSKSVPCLRLVSHMHQLSKTYLTNGTFLDSLVTDELFVNFIGAGFNQFESAYKVPSSNTYGGSVSSDFVNQATDVRQDNSGNLPEKFTVEQNYPNPFNPRTEIRFTLPSNSHVRLTVFNIEGQAVKLLVDQSLSAGTYTADWDGTDQSGRQVASG
ncbi:MAG TPA: FlgD immunoglobulin-like domain containing protein, partial [Candidatus Acidoferrum sp.]|nr:FlgD immunoglobulin-like domain containing protein [Candidatus Acidoferrum sp.]